MRLFGWAGIIDNAGRQQLGLVSYSNRPCLEQAIVFMSMRSWKGGTDFHSSDHFAYSNGHTYRMHSGILSPQYSGMIND